MESTISSRNVEYYRKRASEMRVAAIRAESEELNQLYNRAAKSWQELADMAEKQIERQQRPAQI